MKQPRRADTASSQRAFPLPQETHRELERKLEAVTQKLAQTEFDLQQSRTERAQLEAQVSLMNTLAALGQMAATVAHEIRNPLGGIAGFAGLLERDLSIGDPRRKWVKKIIEGVSSLNAIVTGLLNYTRPVRLNAHRIDLVSLIEESASFLEIDLARRPDQGISVARAYEAPDAPCLADPEQMQQVFLNLLQNAAQAMPDGGTITVSVRVDAETRGHGDAENPPFSASPPLPVGDEGRGWVEVAVADTGEGMSEEVQGRLFTPFFTTKENGTGLGLATARKIIEAHRGTIRVTSEVGRGSTFRIALPAS
jgi:signal transduction histidine kinase